MAMYLVNKEIEKLAEAKNITVEEAIKSSSAEIHNSSEGYEVWNRRNQNTLLAEVREAEELAQREANRKARLSTYHWTKEDGDWVVAGNFEGKRINDIITVLKANGEKQERMIVDFTGTRNAIVK